MVDNLAEKVNDCPVNQLGSLSIVCVQLTVKSVGYTGVSAIQGCYSAIQRLLLVVLASA